MPTRILKMRTVTVNKAELLTMLESNMKAHEADFLLAWEGFLERAKQENGLVLARLMDAKLGDRPRLSINLEQPENHADDYARAIAMCNWEVASEVQLDESEFRQYVQDEWSWTRGFTVSNMLYAGSERPSRP